MFGRLFQRQPERPFQAVVPAALPASTDESADGQDAPPPGDWSVDDIEAAYQRALQAAESVEVESEAAALPEGLVETQPESLTAEPADESALAVAAADSAPTVTPRQIIEALLFVGGRPLTSRQLADVLGGSMSTERVEEDLTRLNADYLAEQRPYEVRLGEGGYRLDLRSEYEKVRARVFGVGPREVRLPQPALEVLALVAYQQPVTRDAVEASGIAGAGSLLRQLVRRELIRLERRGEGEVFRTTERFLQLFGLRSLADLPRPEAIAQR